MVTLFLKIFFIFIFILIFLESQIIMDNDKGAGKVACA